MCRSHGVGDLPGSHYQHELRHVVHGSNILEICTTKKDLNISANRPDLIFVNDVSRCAHIIDISVQLDINVGRKAAEKRIKYTPLSLG